MQQIETGGLRVRAIEAAGRYHLAFMCMRENVGWTDVLATGVLAPPYPSARTTVLVNEDPAFTWFEGVARRHTGGFFTTATVDGDGRRLVLSGRSGPHLIEEALTITGVNRVHVTVTAAVAASSAPLRLHHLMSHVYFVPQGKAARSVEPLDFAWLPALHKREEHVCADHFFRSPAVIVQAEGFYAALVPDLILFARQRVIDHALDLRTTGTPIEAPRLSYGLCSAISDAQAGHTYFAHDADSVRNVAGGLTLRYGFDLFFGRAERPHEVVDTITAHLWHAYGHPTFGDIRPQVLPFEEYGRRYAYVHELSRSVRTAVIDGQECMGIDNAGRRGSNFHAWENDLHVAYGLRHYATKWRDEHLRGVADGILHLALRAPCVHGAFPCIYNFEAGGYEGTLFWTARAADPIHGYDTAAMGVTSWWQLYWHEDLEKSSELWERIVSYARFLAAAQLPSGAIPTYFSPDLLPARQLRASATTAISGAVLAKVATLTDDPALTRAALCAGRFVIEEIVPQLAFDDFEAYYSCSPKPLYAIDYWTGIRPHNNLSIQWAADQCLALYRLTGDDAWLHNGRYLVGILSLYQQVWAPSHLSGYLFGGFGVMNTDGEWNDGRQARFVSTYADYYEATGAIDYLERAVAACRASFATMDIVENHENGINAIVMSEGPGLGYAPENVHHTGPDWTPMWTGFDWSAGGALAASAYLERRFGAVCVDGAARRAIPIDGTAVSIEAWTDERINLRVASALATLPYPSREPRDVTVTFVRLPASTRHVSINGLDPAPLRLEAWDGRLTVRVRG